MSQLQRSSSRIGTRVSPTTHYCINIQKLHQMHLYKLSPTGWNGLFWSIWWKMSYHVIPRKGSDMGMRHSIFTWLGIDTFQCFNLHQRVYDQMPCWTNLYCQGNSAFLFFERIWRVTLFKYLEYFCVVRTSFRWLALNSIAF